MIEMLRSSLKPNGQEAGDLTIKKLSKKERNRSLDKGATYEAVTKKRLLGLLELHFAQ